MNKIWTVDIIFPVFYDNIDILEKSTAEVLKYVKGIQGPYVFKIIISINGHKANKIIAKAKTICRDCDSVFYMYSEKPGKGYGVLNAWKNSSADILTYMDIDLATSLQSFEQMIYEIRKGTDIAVGSRYLATSKIKRSLLRYLMSKIYHIFLINKFLRLPIKDVQCGFKAIKKSAFQQLRFDISNYEFFFEAEMLFLAYRLKMKIVEIPVFWKESKVSGLRILETSFLFIISIIKLKFSEIFGKRRL